jgi:hypothetical protein
MSASTTKKKPHKEPGKEERAELALLPVNQFSLTRWRLFINHHHPIQVSSSTSVFVLSSPPLPPLCPPRSLSPPLVSPRRPAISLGEKIFFVSVSPDPRPLSGSSFARFGVIPVRSYRSFVRSIGVARHRDFTLLCPDLVPLTPVRLEPPCSARLGSVPSGSRRAKRIRGSSIRRSSQCGGDGPCRRGQVQAREEDRERLVWGALPR